MRRRGEEYEGGAGKRTGNLIKSLSHSAEGSALGKVTGKGKC